MQVSVIMPCRAPAVYTQLAVQSILQQSCRDFEFIIVNDDAPADTQAYLRSLRDPRVRLIHQSSNIGHTASLNAALQAATAPLICRMDADDIAHPRRLELQLRYLREHPSIDVLGTQMKFIDPQGRPIRTPHRNPLTHTKIAYQLLWSNALCHPSVVFRRQVILAAGGYQPAYNGCEDYHLWTQLISTHSFANLAQSLLCYRVHPTQFTQVTQKNLQFQKVKKSLLLAYRQQVTGLPAHLCDESTWAQDPAAATAFYQRLAQIFPSGSHARDITRRLYRTLPQPLGRAQRATLRQLHWPTALRYGLF